MSSRFQSNDGSSNASYQRELKSTNYMHKMRNLLLGDVRTTMTGWTIDEQMLGQLRYR